MDFNKIKEQDKKYIANTYKRADVLACTALGSNIEGDKNYIDFSAGIGVNCLGFNSPTWVEAIKNQLDKIGHMSNLYYTLPQVELAEKLCERTNMKRVFFANSGAEANEGAIKTARKYSADKYGEDRYEIITLVNSFHGRTIATLAATGQDVFHKNFGPFPDGFIYAIANDIADINAKVSDKTCAIFLECIQGEGGVIPLSEDFINAVSNICLDKDILLVIDEVQTGIGRSGKFLCSEYFDIKPDIITLAKGLGGGLPIGAVLFGKKTMDTLSAGDHATTFGGNPIICAGALAVLNTIDNAFMADVIVKSEYIIDRVLKIPSVKSVTGKGLMLGIEIEETLNSADIAAACAQKGLIVLTAKQKIRLLPPLTISIEDINEGLDILEKVLNQ